MIKKFNLSIVWLGLIWLLTACGSNDPASNTLPTKPVTIIATDIAYNLPEIDLMVWQPLQLTLDNEGALEHDFTIAKIPLARHLTESETGGGHDMSNMSEMPDIHVSAVAGTKQTITFTPTAGGTYEYWCTVVGHKEAGMVGKLVVATP